MATKPKPVAYRIIQKDASGRNMVVLVDINTGLIVPEGIEDTYELYDSQEAAIKEMNAEADKEEKKAIAQGKPFDRKAWIVSRANGHEKPAIGKDFQPGQENNFGYINKPKALGLANFIPGPVGMAAKAVNTAINANNVNSKNTVRTAMGLDPLSKVQAAKGVLTGVDGDVARMKAPNDREYTVGLTALDAQGRTTLTRDEANKRGIRGKAQEIGTAKAKSGGGVISGTIDAVSSAIDKVFGKPPEGVDAAAAPVGAGVITGQSFGDKAKSFVASVREGNILSKITGIDFDKDDNYVPGQTPKGETIEGKPPTSTVASAFRVSPNIQDVNTGEITSGTDTSNIADGSFGGLATDQAGRFGGNAAISYANIGSGRPHKVSKQHEDYLSGVVGGVLGEGSTVDTISGDINPSDPGWSANGSKLSKSHRHTDEMGADVRFDKPDGSMLNYNNPQDRVALGDIAMSAAAKNPDVGLGFGLGYMGPNTMHIDQSGRGRTWGGNIGDLAYSGTDVNNIDFARQTGIGPTPTYNAPTPQDVNSLRAPSDMTYFGDDEKTIARAKIDAVFDSIMAQASQNIARQNPVDQYGVPISKVSTTSIKGPVSNTTNAPVAELNPSMKPGAPFARPTAISPVSEQFSSPYTTKTPVGPTSNTTNAPVTYGARAVSPPGTTRAQTPAVTFDRLSGFQPSADFANAAGNIADHTVRGDSLTRDYDGISSTRNTGLRSESTANERADRGSTPSSGYNPSGNTGAGKTGGSGRATSRSDATGIGYSGATGAGKTGGSGRASSYGDATGKSSSGSSTSTSNHSSEHERDSSLSGGSSYSGGFSSSGSPSRGIGRA